MRDHSSEGIEHPFAHYYQANETTEVAEDRVQRRRQDSQSIFMLLYHLLLVGDGLEQ